MMLIPSDIHNEVKHFGGKFVVDAGLKSRLPKFGEILNCK
jgi:hypothetical protein